MKVFRAKHNIGQVLMGGVSFQTVDLMDHQFGEPQSFRGGGEKENRSLAGETGLPEVAWDRNPRENKQLCGTRTIT